MNVHPIGLSFLRSPTTSSIRKYGKCLKGQDAILTAEMQSFMTAMKDRLRDQLWISLEYTCSVRCCSHLIKHTQIWLGGQSK